MAIGEVLAAITSFKNVFDILEKLKGKLPESSEKAELTEKMEQTQKAAQMAEADAANALGYKLCKCTWPPQIMLSIGYAEGGNHECYKCPSCQKILPNPNRPKRATASYY